MKKTTGKKQYRIRNWHTYNTLNYEIPSFLMMAYNRG